MGSAMATYVAGNVVGGFTGRSIAGLTAEYCDWRVAFITLALTTVAGGFLAWWLLPAAKRKTKTKQDGFMWSAITTHLKNPSLLITFAIGSMILFSIIAAFTYINYRLAAPPYNFSSGSLSYLFSVYLVGAFVTPFSGKMIDRLGFRKAFTIAGALSLIGLLATLSTSIVIIALGLAVFCSCIFICQSSTTSSLGQLAPGQRSTAAGLYVFFYYLGGSLGGYLPGLVYDFGGWTSCVALIAVVQISALSIAWFFWKARESKSKLQEMQAYS